MEEWKRGGKEEGKSVRDLPGDGGSPVEGGRRKPGEPNASGFIAGMRAFVSSASRRESRPRKRRYRGRSTRPITSCPTPKVAKRCPIMPRCCAATTTGRKALNPPRTQTRLLQPLLSRPQSTDRRKPSGSPVPRASGCRRWGRAGTWRPLTWCGGPLAASALDSVETRGGPAGIPRQWRRHRRRSRSGRATIPY